MRTRTVAIAVALVGLAACARNEDGPARPTPGTPPIDRPRVDSGVSPPPVHDGGTIIQAAEPPPPISGGTLALTPDGTWLVAADPELDTISIVDVETATLRDTIELTDGDEPGRVVIDGAGRGHVVLRSAGAIADVDLASGALIARRPVCAVPRGIAWRASDDSLHVACTEGTLVSLPASGGEPTRRVHVADDLRDVVVDGSDLYVTTFRTAHLLRLDAAGTIVSDAAPREIAIEGLIPMRLTAPGPFQPAVAWRALSSGEGVMMLHQRALSAEFVAEGGYGGGGCGGAIVHTSVSELVAGEMRSGDPLGGVVLGVDVALSPDGLRIAVAAPANAYPRNGGITTVTRSSGDVLVYSRSEATTSSETPTCANGSMPRLEDVGAAIAVLFLPDGRVVAQTRAPSRVLFEAPDPDALVGPVVALGDEDTYDTGHMLFHAAAGGGIACASCHPEGGDDARTWRFAGIGPRRTQTMRGGLLDTAPFHWDGDMREFRDLVHGVFVGRMGGAVFEEGEIGAFGAWMDALPALPRPADADTDRVERGRALFHDATVACATCHAGSALTNSATVDVGTGKALQVPTLLGIVYRAPYMHDGCAPTLRDRFTPGACTGGDAHGRTSHLTSAQIDDLVAYLQTL
ncbi:c-type cytochrome [Sandaracinus amylolyticus]|uniref:Cytochrome c551 peroxidase n=1 Tax=Sandaracinus amylolyticus TaxID=927083 RepID=A0A0F6W137_9BACT|nr:c-type cytochrome [Sandaracinus amylolyticus]AKF04577.1 Cytochrome c551 peroxidase [Sandaracinus amylolyticus]